MKLNQLHLVTQEIEIEHNKIAIPFSCYYFFDNQWFELETESPVTEAIQNNLSSAKNKSYYRRPDDTNIWLCFDCLDMAICTRHSTKITDPTIKALREKIEKSIKNATNAYKVSHNQLTKLLAKDTFKTEVELLLEEERGVSASSSTEGQQPKTIAVLAFDIDKFKQVNDTYGHLYGDQVLKAFAFRLEEVADEINNRLYDKVKVVLGHPSGEEFLACIAGTISTEELSEIADSFRCKISEEPLPSEDEWKLLLRQPGLSNVEPPQLHDRKITTSIGVALYTGSLDTSSSSVQSETLLLLDRADTALFRSKTGGRNRVTHFDEILQNCGRVLEFDIDTGVAAIDIGSKVGVVTGQEFRVFSSIYSGSTPFIVDDGRSKRTLGVYPRVETGRLVVINTQSELSFGQLIQKESSSTQGTKSIKSGALLEAVPLGNISHLLEQQTMFGSHVVNIGGIKLISVKELQENLDKILGRNQHPFVAVMRFQNEQGYIRKYGSASLNRALARLYSGTTAILPSSASIGLIDRTSVCIIGVDSQFKLKVDEISKMFVDKFSADSELIPICGYFYKNSKSTKDISNLPEKNAIDFARYAASMNEEAENQTVQFSEKIAENILSKHRTANAYKAGIADYLRLKELGVTSASFENHAGLCYSALQENVEAWGCYRRAMEGEPTHTVYIGNYGILSDRLGEVDNGLKAFEKLATEAGLKKLINTPHGYIAYASLLAKGNLRNSPHFNPNVFLDIGPKALLLEAAKNWPSAVKQIQSVLAKLQ